MILNHPRVQHLTFSIMLCTQTNDNKLYLDTLSREETLFSTVLKQASFIYTADYFHIVISTTRCCVFSSLHELLMV